MSPTQSHVTETKSRPVRQTGRIKSWGAKGYGFIQPDDGDEDLFAHVSRVRQGYVPAPDDPVSYRVIPGPNGRQAIDVAPLLCREHGRSVDQCPWCNA